MKHFVLAGRTGVGKSSFVNTAFGGQLAKVDRYEACTKMVDYYARTTEYGDICLIDTPGLAEGNGEHDVTYLSMVKDRIKDLSIDAFIYVTPLHETRFRSEEQEALARITQVLGPAIWSSSWLVFTFAASVPDGDRTRAVDEHLHHFHSLLARIARPGGFLGGYRGFRNVLLVDNKAPRWNATCRPLAAFLA